MKRLLFLLLVLLPTLASSQHFVCNFDVNLYSSASTTFNPIGSVDKGDKVLVEKLQYNGWCYVTVNDTQKGYMKIKRLDPVDDAAIEMKALADNRVSKEKQTVIWSIIIVVATLLLSLILKKSKLRLPVMVAGTIAVSAIELLYLTTGYEFTFYSPFVVGGWKWAALYFIVFVVFFVMQFYLWLKTLMLIAEKAGKLQGGCFISVIAMVLAFVALIITVLLNKEAEWNPYIFWGVVISQIIQVIIFFIYYVRTPLIALMYTCTYIVGFAALLYTAMDAVVVVICGMLIATMLSGFGKMASTITRTVKTPTGEKTEVVSEGIDIMDNLLK